MSSDDNAIRLVQGDSLPYVYLNLSGSLTGEALNLADPNTVVRVRFRSTRSRAVLKTILCEKVEADQGRVRFSFSNGTLDVPPGPYEGEIEIDFDGQTETIFDVLKFVVRSQFA